MFRDWIGNLLAYRHDVSGEEIAADDEPIVRVDGCLLIGRTDTHGTSDGSLEEAID